MKMNFRGKAELKIESDNIQDLHFDDVANSVARESAGTVNADGGTWIGSSCKAPVFLS